MMLTDKLLADAAAEVNEAMLRSLPEPGDCAPEFSPRFERQMRWVLRRGNHPAAYRAMQRAASIALVLLIGFAMLMAVSPTVRANVWGWIRERYESWVIYRYEDAVPSDVAVIEYKLIDLPEGYTEIRRSNMPDIETIVYEDADGSCLFFSYSKNQEAIMYLVKAEGYAIEEVEVRDMKGEVYSAEDASNSNCIIWSDDTENTMFYISGYFNREELIDLAESVRRKDGYLLTGLPDGYTMVDAREDSERYISVFINEKEAQMIDFTYGFTDLYLGMDGYDIVPAMVDGKEAELYLSREPDRNNSVIWSDKETRLIFYVSAPMERDELIALAESVEPID